MNEEQGPQGPQGEWGPGERFDPDIGREAEPKEPRHRSHGGLVGLLILAFVVAMAAGGFGICSTVRADRLSDRVESLEKAQGEWTTLMLTMMPGPDDVQSWLDTGQVDMRIQVSGSDVRAPLGCFTGDYARWEITGLGC